MLLLLLLKRRIRRRSYLEEVAFIGGEGLKSLCCLAVFSLDPYRRNLSFITYKMLVCNFGAGSCPLTRESF